MNLDEALEVVIAQDHHERWRELCDESWPDHAAYRELVMRKARGESAAQKETEAAQLEPDEPRSCCGGISLPP
jgi:hypothetical protein